MKNITITGREAHNNIKKILYNNDWAVGYQFRHSEYFFLTSLETKVNSDKKCVLVSFTIEYKTKAHRVINNVVWKYPYEKSYIFEKDLENLEKDIMLKTSDPDRTDQVFNKRFNAILFKEKDYASKGWIIKK